MTHSCSISVATPKAMYLDAQQRAQQFAQAHVIELAQEILEWHATAKLRGPKLRSLASITQVLDPMDPLDKAEGFAVTAALQLVVAQTGLV